MASTVQYTYDQLGRLISETRNNEVERFTYYPNGNIQSREVIRNNVTVSKEEYQYDTVIKDRLLRIKDFITGNVIQDITYDSKFVFNPKQMMIKGVLKTLTWEGKRLTGITGNTYQYNNEGIRTKKITSNETTTFELEGSNIISLNKTTSAENVRLDFVYDASSTLIGVNTTEGHYFYTRDITGNILGLIDSTGKYIVKYKYDAWGKVLEKKIYETCIASRHNPFVYKGYFLDEETSFYYLKSRYYDPTIRRFISIDSPEYINQEDLSGLNLYAYCGNDPVHGYDPSGHFVLWAMVLIGTLVGAAVGFVFDAGKQLINNGWDFSEVDWGSAVNSGIVGGALGFSLAMGVGYLGPVIAGTATAGGLTAGGAFAISTAVSFGAGALGYASEEWINGRTPSFGKAMMHGGFVALEGMINFGVGGIVGSLGNGTKGKFLTSKEWWGKFVFGLEFTQPLKIGIDLIRKNI